MKILHGVGDVQWLFLLINILGLELGSAILGRVSDCYLNLLVRSRARLRAWFNVLCIRKTANNFFYSIACTSSIKVQDRSYFSPNGFGRIFFPRIARYKSKNNCYSEAYVGYRSQHRKPTRPTNVVPAFYLHS